IDVGQLHRRNRKRLAVDPRIERGVLAAQRRIDRPRDAAGAGRRHRRCRCGRLRVGCHLSRLIGISLLVWIRLTIWISRRVWISLRIRLSLIVWLSRRVWCRSIRLLERAAKSAAGPGEAIVAALSE